MEKLFGDLNIQTKINLALSYENPHIIAKFCEEHNFDQEIGNEYFIEVKKFLYLCSNTTDSLAPSAEIDKIWHVFILFTRDYRQYCAHFLGKFIDHIPEVSKKNLEFNDSFENYLLNTITHYEKVFGELNNKIWQVPFKNNTENYDGLSCTDCLNYNDDCRSCSSCSGRGSQPSCVFTGNCYNCQNSGYSCIGENPNDI